MEETIKRPAACSIERAMSILGERWTMLILRESFWGVNRFTEMQRNLGIARNILSTRLQALVAAGVLERVLYRQDPDRYEYRLTPMGLDLYPVVVSIMRWGDRHLLKPGEDGPPLEIVHEACGEPARPVLVCSHCGEPLHARSSRPVPGAGVQEHECTELRAPTHTRA